MQSLFATHAWLGNGWANNVSLSWNAAGDLIQVEPDSQPQAGQSQVHYLLPGMCNLHSHAFQRAMAGLTEIAGPGKDSFWTWRDLMYRYALQISPEQLQAIAAQLYVECLRHGYTAICEFHYVHRDPRGQWYADQAEMSRRILAAASETGIGLTHLPVLYSYADFSATPLREDQRRFASDVEAILNIVGLLEPARSAQLEVGVAPHSLRATTLTQIQQVAQHLPAQRPLHIHIAEQQKEVEGCLQHYGQRPVQYLLDAGVLSPRWCLVHATHLDAREITGLAASGAVAGICPSTEANLGDGFFALPEYLAQGGRLGIGTDSHASQSLVEELRWLEYGQRLRLQGRNIATSTEQSHVADLLWQTSLAGGAQASGRRIGVLASGYRADFIALDETHVNLQDLDITQVLNSWIFAGNENLVRDVWVGGQHLIQNGQHRQQQQIQQAYSRAVRDLRQL